MESLSKTTFVEASSVSDWNSFPFSILLFKSIIFSDTENTQFILCRRCLTRYTLEHELPGEPNPSRGINAYLGRQQQQMTSPTDDMSWFWEAASEELGARGIAEEMSGIMDLKLNPKAPDLIRMRIAHEETVEDDLEISDVDILWNGGLLAVDAFKAVETMQRPDPLGMTSITSEHQNASSKLYLVYIFPRK